ncbi:MAG: GTP pyrophosphokinase family protein [Clostridiaceae bacterium]
MIIKKSIPLLNSNNSGRQIDLHSFINVSSNYLEMENLYQSAIKEISTKLEILDDEFKLKYSRNPIHDIQCRLKSLESIIKKLERKGHEISIESAKKNLFDIAGVRVVCSYIEDIYIVADLLKAQDDIILVRETDYIQNPKPNGYRSLHLVVKIPVFFSDRKELVPVEIQIRTMAMDFWASLEHQLRYKSSGHIPSSIVQELKECAETIASTDLKMQRIYSALENLEENVEIPQVNAT